MSLILLDSICRCFRSHIEFLLDNSIRAHTWFVILLFPHSYPAVSNSNLVLLLLVERFRLDNSCWLLRMDGPLDLMFQQGSNTLQDISRCRLLKRVLPCFRNILLGILASLHSCSSVRPDIPLFLDEHSQPRFRVSCSNRLLLPMVLLIPRDNNWRPFRSGVFLVLLILLDSSIQLCIFHCIGKRFRLQWFHIFLQDSPFERFSRSTCRVHMACFRCSQYDPGSWLS